MNPLYENIVVVQLKSKTHHILYISTLTASPQFYRLYLRFERVLQFFQNHRVRKFTADVVIYVSVTGILVFLYHAQSLGCFFAGLVEWCFEGIVQHVALAVIATYDGFYAAHLVQTFQSFLRWFITLFLFIAQNPLSLFSERLPSVFLLSEFSLPEGIAFASRNQITLLLDCILNIGSIFRSFLVYIAMLFFESAFYRKRCETCTLWCGCRADSIL